LCSGSPVGTTTNPSSYTDSTATAGVTYYYSVKAYGTVGASTCSGSNSGYRAVSPPTNVQARDGTYTNKVRITWTAPTGGASSYKVYRSTSNTCGAFLGNATGTSYDDTTAIHGVTYYYSVRSVGANGTMSGCSTTNSGYRALVPPTNVQASDGQYPSYVHITWTAAPGTFGSYTLYRSTGNTLCGTVLVTGISPTATAYNDASAADNQVYYYSMKAVTPGASACSTSNSGYR
jgi:fibronectin type 3 domain-containing protein